ncbi:MAG TPA: pyridoxal-dependent decarboxylase [Gaiellaceae bacterium]
MTDDLRDLLALTAELAADFHDSLPERPVLPQVSLEELRASLVLPLPEDPVPARTVVTDLAAAADAGVVAEAGGRYFGFVIGGHLPAALAADWLTSAWDQNAALYVAGPAASVVEEAAAAWLVDLLALPREVSYGFVTSGQAANFTALAAARHHVLEQAGWDVEARGLAGAPPIRTVVGASRHGTIDRALRMLGLGAPTDVVRADDQGRMLPGELPRLDGPAIVCAQAGEVNTGAFDDLAAIRERAPGAWLHVDGAFGLWAAASPAHRALVAGHERADSWSTDAHKWLNVPYDSGIAFTAHPDSHRAAFAAQAAYLKETSETREPFHWVPEHSRRARGFAVYAAIRSLGRSGVAALVDRCCAHARAFAAGLEELGAEVLNDVVLNQVLFRFATDEQTERALGAVQAGGEAFMSGTTWAGRAAIRVSVSNWQTSEADVERALAAYARANTSSRQSSRKPIDS